MQTTHRTICARTGCEKPRYTHHLYCFEHSAQDYLEHTLPSHAVAQSMFDQADGAAAYRAAPRCRASGCGHKAARTDGLCLRCGEESDALNRGETADWPDGLWTCLRYILIVGSILVILTQLGMWLGWLPRGGF